MNCRRTISRVLHYLGYITHASTWRAKSLNIGRILMFHGVGDENYPAEEFEAHLRYLQRNFEIVSLEMFLRKLDGAGDRLANATVLTFDDGLRNHFTVAYPILRRLNLPATFFVCPGLIESQRWLWNQEARARLRALSKSDRDKFASQWLAAAGGDIEKIIDCMKALRLKRRNEREQVLRELTANFRASAEQRRNHDIMNWDELRSMNPELITVGSHTVNHPVLSTLGPEELGSELAGSRYWLEEKLGRKIQYFCYPNGAFNPAVVELARQTYTAAVTTEPGFVTPAADRHVLPRIGSTETRPLLAWRMHRPTA